MLPLIAMTVMTQGIILPEDLAKQVDQKRLKATVEKLASWNDRNTNNPTLTEAADWIAGELKQIPGLQVEIMKYRIPKMGRVPEEKDVVQVVAVLPGETNHRILVGGHFDTINMVDKEKGLQAKSPGANDDASGVALTMELARIMSQRKWRNTLVFVAFSGEEQGLFGSKALAARAVAEKWSIDAVLNNDTVGSSGNKNRQRDEKHIRLFSADYSAADKNPHHSRELARAIEFLTRDSVDDFGVKLIFRNDRFGRGGDHTPFMQEGFSAVRFTELFEEYSQQHTEDDLPNHMDFKYLSNVAKTNLVAMGYLGDADEAPTDVKIDRSQGHDTTVTWKAKPGVRYAVYWRDTASPVWENSVRLGTVSTYTAKKLSKDDYIFAVGAVGGVPVEAK